MVEIGKMKIKRKAYVFDVKKRFQPMLHYKVKERPPIEIIKAQIRSFISPKPAAKKAVEGPAPPTPGGFNFAVLGAAVLIALIILMVAWTYLTAQLVEAGAGILPEELVKPEMENTVMGGEVLTAGERGTQERVAAILFYYSLQNIYNYTVTINTYDDKLPSEVFVLSSEKIEATTYSDFLNALRAKLARKKILVNEITEKQLETIPEGAIILVPSGMMPQGMLGVGSKLSMEKLASRNMVVIYIGQPLTKMLNGTDVVSTPQDIVKSLPVTFDESSPPSSETGFHLFQPFYRATARGAGWSSTTIYGSVSVLKKGSGAYLFIPQTLDGGWSRNFTSAADDISRIVFEIPWAKSQGAAKTYVFSSVNVTNETGSLYLFSNPFKSDHATVKLDFAGYSHASNFPIEESLISYQQKIPRGELYIKSGFKVVPTNITNNLLRINAKLNEPAAAQPNMFLTIFDAAGNEVQSFPQGNLNVQAEASFDVPVYVDRGEYVVKLMDDTGNVYAQTFMKVVSIDVTFRGFYPQKPFLYYFDMTMDGTPISLKDLSVAVDNGQFGTYKFSDVSSVAVDVSRFTGGDALPYGNHIFNFVAGGLKVNVSVPRPRPQSLFTNPLFWVTIILTIGVVGVGVIFARQEKAVFFIDIPDFPPVARTKVPLSEDVVLGLFQRINENYRWQNTPLTSTEIKNSFKDVFYKGKPVYVTDYNVEYLLEELEKRGKVAESMGYYGLVEWEAATKKSIRYLALMRRLRDICVNNAIPFTGLGESKIADSEVTMVGQQMFLHFYEKDVDSKVLLSRALSTIGKGITIILFTNPSDKDQFQTLLYSPSPAPVILKMEVESSSVLFQTTEEFEKMLMEFKTM